MANVHTFVGPIVEGWINILGRITHLTDLGTGMRRPFGLETFRQHEIGGVPENRTSPHFSHSVVVFTGWGHWPHAQPCSYFNLAWDRLRRS